MVDEPHCPGVGPHLNQPTVRVVARTMIWPSGCKPSVPTLVETSIAGMTSPIGTECLSALIAVVGPAGCFVVVVVGVVGGGCGGGCRGRHRSRHRALAGLGA